ncbi:hypothetical protein [Rhodococcus sp. H29-C3]|uniref:hypothetical protein n=1 Tax=Rhodococcus sp. H29-C3 TaxID=3046307 RepID=UPI0024BAAD82|nr:hypothetical protein [Rhodococcus sp. H29-C3]MDJ0361852.1 hypothetical protein [Rhodococcus sp. H29-C3]
MTLRSSLRRAAVVGGTFVAVALAAAPSAQAAGTYVEGDNITSIVTWSGLANCIGLTWTDTDGSVRDEIACGGVAQLDQPAVKGHWAGLEPKVASGTAIACHTYNSENGQTFRQNTHYWEKASISGFIADALVSGSAGTPAPLCQVLLQ